MLSFLLALNIFFIIIRLLQNLSPCSLGTRQLRHHVQVIYLGLAWSSTQDVGLSPTCFTCKLLQVFDISFIVSRSHVATRKIVFERFLLSEMGAVRPIVAGPLGHFNILLRHVVLVHRHINVWRLDQCPNCHAVGQLLLARQPRAILVLLLLLSVVPSFRPKIHCFALS